MPDDANGRWPRLRSSPRGATSICRQEERRKRHEARVVVFLTGASGFIGQHLADALRAAGHRVIAGVHRRPLAGVADTVQVDFARDFDPALWRPRLIGVDAVINAVGLIRPRRCAREPSQTTRSVSIGSSPRVSAWWASTLTPNCIS